MDYIASRGTTGMAIAGLTTGIIGTLGSIGGIAAAHGGVGNSNYVTKAELDYVQALGAKDSQIALLQSENDSEKKMIEVYTALAKQDKELRAELQTFKDSQNQFNAAQMSINAVNGTNIANIQAQLAEITKTYVPNAAVMPGWTS